MLSNVTMYITTGTHVILFVLREDDILIFQLFLFTSELEDDPVSPCIALGVKAKSSFKVKNGKLTLAYVNDNQP